MSGILGSPSTISSTPNVEMSPLALPPDPSIMSIMAVKENERNKQNRQQREDDDALSLHQELQLERLPAAAAFSNVNSVDALNETISSSSLKDSLLASNSLKLPPLKGKSNRDQNLESSKSNGKKIKSKMNGNHYSNY